MEYYIVEKFEYVNNEFVHTEIGYVTSIEDRDYINTKDYNSLITWLNDNENNRKNQTVNMIQNMHL